MNINVSDKIVMMPVEKVKPYIRNPRKNDRTVALLVDIIPKVGFNVPLVIDKKGVIVKGHARFTAALRLGMTHVPCVITEADEETIKLDRIADNKISEFSEWVTDELLHEIDSLNIDFDLESLGLPAMGLEDAFEPVFPEDDTGDKPFEETTQGPSQEEMRKRFEAFLAQKQQKEEGRLEREVQKAEERLEAPPKQEEYIKVICEQCGHEMYIRASDIGR